MREEKGITIISLVVTIIILIILAGISINLILGEDGLITKAKQAKENIELAQIEEQTHLNELYAGLNSQLGASGDISYDTIAKLAEFKKSIADYIEEAGGIKPEYSADTITFGDSIKGIVKEVTKNATATADNITEGKTAWVNGNLITGTKNDNTSPSITKISSSALDGRGPSGGKSSAQINVASTFPEEYKNFTVDNFLFIPTSFGGGSYAGGEVWTTGNFAKSYNAESGILTLNTTVTIGGGSCYYWFAFIYFDVYLIK